MHLFNLKKSLVFLYICLVALLAAVTFVEHVHGTEFVEKYVYHTVWFVVCGEYLPHWQLPCWLSGSCGGVSRHCCCMAPSSLSWWEP